jgi:hypothetical protein
MKRIIQRCDRQPNCVRVKRATCTFSVPIVPQTQEYLRQAHGAGPGFSIFMGHAENRKRQKRVEITLFLLIHEVKSEKMPMVAHWNKGD